MLCYGQWWLGRRRWHLCFWGYHWDSRELLLSWLWELWPRSQCANLQSSWHFLKTRQIMEVQENQFASENKALQALVLSMLLNSAELWPVSVTNEKELEAAHHRWQWSILGISWKDKVTNKKVREATALPKLEDIIRCRRLRWLGHLSRMDHYRLPLRALTGELEGFRRPGQLWQNWKDVVKKDLRKMGISCEEAAEDRRSWRNRVPNASLTQDEPGTLPVAQPVVTKHWREKYHILWTYSPQAHPGSSILVLTTKGWLPLGEGWQGSCQPSDAITP